MAFPFSPKIIYGATTLVMAQSTATFAPDRMIVGGESESAAGVPERFVVRKDGLFTMKLLLLQTELTAVTAWLDWCFDNGSQGFFSFYPDQAGVLNYQSWLVKPKIGENWGFSRVSNYMRAFTLDVTIRSRTNGTMFDVQL